MTINARQAMDAIFLKWGYNIILQRRIHKDNSTKKEFSNTLERHTVRSRIPGASTTEQMEGALFNADLIYYFRFDANPREGDRIYENFEDSGQDVRVFDITYVAPMRGKNGIVDYWTVGAQREVTE